MYNDSKLYTKTLIFVFVISLILYVNYDMQIIYKYENFVNQNRTVLLIYLIQEKK